MQLKNNSLDTSRPDQITKSKNTYIVINVLFKRLKYESLR